MFRIFREIAGAAAFIFTLFAIREWPAMFGFSLGWTFGAIGLQLAAQVALSMTIGTIMLFSKDAMKKAALETMEAASKEPDNVDRIKAMNMLSQMTHLGNAMFRGVEDMIFVFPLLWLDASVPIAVAASSAIFVLWHAEHPLPRRAAIAAYVAISYLIAKEHGMLTVILAHGLFDFGIAAFRKTFTHKIASRLKGSL